MTLSATTRSGIYNSSFFATILPEGGLDGTPGEEQLEYAIALGKHVMVIRVEGREAEPLPRLLESYDDYCETGGTAEEIAESIKMHTGGPTAMIDGGWG